MRRLTSGFMTLILTHAAQGAFAQTPVRTAALEARVVEDSTGCPTAIDIWLTSTSDTIQGIEVVLQWDRPDRIEFVRGKAGKKTTPAAKDSLAAMLRPSDPSTQVAVLHEQSLLSKWEFVDARSSNGLSVKVLGVAKLLGQEAPVPILPGTSGRLFRIPISVIPMQGEMPDRSPVGLTVDETGTRFSTPRGVLFSSVTAKSIKAETTKCHAK